MLELSDVSRAANGGTLLSRVSLNIAAGRPTAIAGLSAPEREALVRLLTGTDRPQGGTIRLGGKDIAQARKDKGRILYVGPEGLTAKGLRIDKLVGTEAARRAGLAGTLDAKVGSLPVSLRVRLALAQARPGLLVIEAPTSKAEAAGRDRLAADLPDLLAGAAGVVVLVAASADEALGLGGDIVVLDGGVVVQAGPAAEVSRHPASLASAAATSSPMLNSVKLLAGEGRCLLPDGSRLQLPEGVNLPAQGMCTLAFHPEDITLERASPGCVRFVVRAGGEEAWGSRRYLRVSFAGASWLSPVSDAVPPPGAVLNAFVDRARLILFDADGRAQG